MFSEGYRYSFDVPKIDRGTLGFKWIRNPDEWAFQMPWWFIMAAAAYCVALPWIKWAGGYSLRVLIALMTMLAVALWVVK